MSKRESKRQLKNDLKYDPAQANSVGHGLFNEVTPQLVYRSDIVPLPGSLIGDVRRSDPTQRSVQPYFLPTLN
jgi:hypothetical protein